MTRASLRFLLLIVIAPACDEVDSGALEFIHITAGDRHSCGIDYDGTSYCWGDNSDGQLGIGPVAGTTRASRVAGDFSFVQLSAGAAHTCGVTISDVAYCWGDNSAGQLGDSTTQDRAYPAPVRNGTNITMVGAGFAHSCGVRVDGTGVCWGANDVGQLGDSTLAPSLVPVRVAGVDLLQRVSAGRNHTCAIRQDYVGGGYPLAYCWGSNEFGQLGDSSTAPRLGAVLVRGLTWVNDVLAGHRHSCAGAGQLGDPHCWGDNSAGQLGDETTDPRPGATPVIGLITGGAPSPGGQFSCILSPSTATYCWGDNTAGQLGTGGIGSPSGLSPVAGDHDFFTFDAGAAHACAVIEGFVVRGPAYCWGDNSSGQLGDGTKVTRLKPVVVIR